MLGKQSQRIVEEIHRRKVKVIYKRDSLFMKILSKILFFNKNFMDNATTTIGRTIYLSNEYDGRSESSKVATLLHEYVHILQAEEDILFPILYLMPQFLVLYSLFAIPFGSFFLLFLLAILPFPAVYRALYEAEAYAVSLYIKDISGGYDMKAELDFVVKTFTGPSYYFMMPFKTTMENWITEQVLHIKEGQPTLNQRAALELLAA